MKSDSIVNSAPETAPRKHPRSRKKAFRLQQTLFSGLLLLLCVIGLLLPLRPERSEEEKRNLTEFPEFTLSAFWDGSFFSKLETWYADTYPLREVMISLNGRFESLFGNRSEQIVGGISDGDKVPDVTTGNEGFEWLYKPDANNPGDKPPSATQPPQTKPEEIPDLGDGTPPPASPVDPDASTEQINNIYVIDDTAYELYYFSQAGADRYVDLVNNLSSDLGKDVDVYSIIAPLAYGIQMDKDLQNKLNLTDEEQALTYMYSQMNDQVKKVFAYYNLLAHRDEYLYFRTDHHWTALGAYYAYEVFCHQKGITPGSLDSMHSKEFEGFLGTLYSGTSKPPALQKNPDTVTAWIPRGTNQMVYYDTAGKKHDWRVISDVSTWGAGSKYGTFIGGDQPLAEIHNPKITDGSSCVVVKNSFGNCFVPFLVDHYETVYVVDFRTFPKWSQTYNNGQTFQEFVKEKGIDDVILMTNITATTSSSLLDRMENCISN